MLLCLSTECSYRFWRKCLNRILRTLKRVCCGQVGGEGKKVVGKTPASSSSPVAMVEVAGASGSLYSEERSPRGPEQQQSREGGQMTAAFCLSVLMQCSPEHSCNCGKSRAERKKLSIDFWVEEWEGARKCQWDHRESSSTNSLNSWTHL